MISPFQTFSRLLAQLGALLALALTPSAAFAQNNAQGSDPISSALLFMQSILLGPIATTLAVMAVAGDWARHRR